MWDQAPCEPILDSASSASIDREITVLDSDRELCPGTVFKHPPLVPRGIQIATDVPGGFCPWVSTAINNSDLQVWITVVLCVW